jgi:aspartyl-tRNA(Asn)/glutamyl-tRNA(Gln) amidotransferase subunit C
MDITPELIDRLAYLSRLEFSPVEKEAFIKDFTRIVGFVEKLQEVDVTDVEPLVYMSDNVNILREDDVHQDITKPEALSNAPLRDSDYFKVPKVLKK